MTVAAQDIREAADPALALSVRRVTTVVLMVCGISLIEALGASIAAYFVETVSDGRLQRIEQELKAKRTISGNDLPALLFPRCRSRRRGEWG
ncbi:MAG: hypothetical protein OXB98_02440 [Bryobacterales bacterium]|nr:hypothetical protein [Bryobacterales bacterium]